MKPFCVYLTIYRGNKLPPFYLGYTKANKIKNENYHGSVSSKKYKQIFNKEIKENPELFTTIRSKKQRILYSKILQITK